MKHAIKYFEMHLMHTCNLNCVYCSHYCDIGYPGAVDFADGEKWLSRWAERVEPQQIRLLGGEPLLHPDLDKYLLAAKKLFPKAKRTVTTNGVLLEARKEILPVMVATGTRINISLHPVPAKWEANIHAALALIDVWERRGLIATIHHSHSDWYLPYLGTGRDILPFSDGRPEASFAAMCGTPEKRCLTLHEGALWQCPQIAYVHNVIGKLSNPGPWERYLSYRPLSVDASDGEFRAFLSAPSLEHCDICPAAVQKVPAEALRGGRDMVAVSDARGASRKRWRAAAKARLWVRELF